MSSTIPGRIVPSGRRPRADVEERDFLLFIEGENWTPYATDVRFTNSGAEGASVLDFAAKRPMDGYEDAEVELWIAKADVNRIKLSTSFTSVAP
jgi:hypothetical protein